MDGRRLAAPACHARWSPRRWEPTARLDASRNCAMACPHYWSTSWIRPCAVSASSRRPRAPCQRHWSSPTRTVQDLCAMTVAWEGSRRPCSKVAAALDPGPASSETRGPWHWPTRGSTIPRPLQSYWTRLDCAELSRSRPESPRGWWERRRLRAPSATEVRRIRPAPSFAWRPSAAWRARTALPGRYCRASAPALLPQGRVHAAWTALVPTRSSSRVERLAGRLAVG